VWTSKSEERKTLHQWAREWRAEDSSWSLFVWKKIAVCCALFFAFCPLSGHFPPVGVAVFILEEPTCLPAHQPHPRRASALSCKVKTHYGAIGQLVMLSNDLISLSVRPVSHRGAPVRSGRLCPRVPAALRHHRRRHAHLASARPHQKPDRALNLWEHVKAERLGTQGVRDFGMKVPGISFTISTLLVRAAQSIRAPFWFHGRVGGERERENWDAAKWLAVTERLVQLSPKSVWGVAVYKMDHCHSDPKRQPPDGGGATEHVRGRKVTRGSKAQCVWVCACVCVCVWSAFCLLPRSPSAPFCETIW